MAMKKEHSESEKLSKIKSMITKMKTPNERTEWSKRSNSDLEEMDREVSKIWNNNEGRLRNVDLTSICEELQAERLEDEKQVFKEIAAHNSPELKKSKCWIERSFLLTSHSGEFGGQSVSTFRCVPGKEKY